MKHFPIMVNLAEVNKVRALEHCFVVVSIPWEMIAPHEKQAIANHSQLLQQLADRGGLSACEALAVLTDKPWKSMTVTEAQRQLFARVFDYAFEGVK